MGKKLAHILISVFMSMIIIFIGTGVNMEYCKHSGTLTLKNMVLDNSTHCSNSTEDISNPSCMDLKQLKISDHNISKIHHEDIDVQFCLVFLDNTFAFKDIAEENRSLLNTHNRELYSPPREYLNQIQVLLI